MTLRIECSLRMLAAAVEFHYNQPAFADERQGKPYNQPRRKVLCADEFYLSFFVNQL
ncbi:MAG TPA: hypothetical protein VKA60_18190 [Blastocatellia bacterium]|nr:hypothetical protein [Blastocatellia bacterium]